MSKQLIKHAEAIRAKYRFEIDRKFDKAEFFRTKFANDLNKIKLIAKLLYKKIN
jgi:hypothetical protein